ncbi:MAG: response regulator transcription factor [Rhodospirillaceae bacterium]
MRLLLVEDESAVAELVRTKLARDGFTVDVAGSSEAARAALQVTNYDAVVLDLRLPDGDGLEVLRGVRDSRHPTPVIVVAARDCLGAPGGRDGTGDDMARPFALEDLVARIGTVLRRPETALGMRLEIANLAFDTSTREVAVCGQPLLVPRRELAALELLMQRAGRVVTKDALESAVYSNGEETDSNAIESHLSRLRKRLREAGAGVAILGVRGVGYMFRAAEAY